jgi:hypothetical protein
MPPSTVAPIRCPSQPRPTARASSSPTTSRPCPGGGNRGDRRGRLRLPPYRSRRPVEEQRVEVPLGRGEGGARTEVHLGRARFRPFRLRVLRRAEDHPHRRRHFRQRCAAGGRDRGRGRSLPYRAADPAGHLEHREPGLRAAAAGRRHRVPVRLGVAQDRGRDGLARHSGRPIGQPLRPGIGAGLRAGSFLGRAHQLNPRARPAAAAAPRSSGRRRSAPPADPHAGGSRGRMDRRAGPRTGPTSGSRPR